MNRYFEIIDENNTIRQLNSNDLPFQISLEKQNNNLSYLLITQIKSDENNVCAHIAESEGHVFFQPDVNLNKIDIFHNDEKIKKSVWLKSGDILLIENKIITYDVSGDIIKIKVSEKNHNNRPSIIEPRLTPPPPIKQALIEQESSKIKQSSKKKYIFIFITIFLLVFAAFILFAKIVKIDIVPAADKLTLSGNFPAIKISDRYMLLSGLYEFKAEKDGYQPLNKTLDINSDNKFYHFSLKEKPGQILFEIKPEINNKIYQDNVLLAKNKKNQYEINRGEYNFVIKNPRFQSVEQKIEIKGIGKQQILKFQLIPNWGFIKFISKIDEASLQIYSIQKNTLEKKYSGKLLNGSEIELISGQYVAKINKEKFKEMTINFNISAKSHKKLEIKTLEPSDAIINVTSKPSGTIIRINGQYKGKTPKIINLTPYIQYQLELSLSGYKKIIQNISFKPGESTEQKHTLKMINGSVFITVFPSSAKLIIDGKIQKESSGRFNLGGKNHLITVKQKGYISQTKKLTTGNYTKNISFDLKKLSLSSNLKIKSLHKKSTSNNYVNTINQKMILIKAMNFSMGSKNNESGRGSNESQYKVKLDYDYYLSDKEVSNKQFRAFKATHTSESVLGTTLDEDKQPVVNVTWNEAAQFANWLSIKEGLTAYYKEVSGKLMPADLSKKNNGYRLPFEVEWVLAARGTMQNKYPWRGTYPPKNMNGNFADKTARPYVTNVIQGYNDQQAVSAPIGSYKKNRSGFYDMGGNVSEWCQDYYSPNPSRSSGSKLIVNPTGPGKGSHKVVKDSSWRDASITELRLSYRSYSRKKAKDLGFRLARYAQ